MLKMADRTINGKNFDSGGSAAGAFQKGKNDNGRLFTNATPALIVLKTFIAALILFYITGGAGFQARADTNGGEKLGRDILIY